MLLYYLLLNPPALHPQFLPLHLHACMRTSLESESIGHRQQLVLRQSLGIVENSGDFVLGFRHEPELVVPCVCAITY